MHFLKKKKTELNVVLQTKPLSFSKQVIFYLKLLILKELQSSFIV